MLELNLAHKKCWGSVESLQVRGCIHTPAVGESSLHIKILLTLDLLDVQSPSRIPLTSNQVKDNIS